MYSYFELRRCYSKYAICIYLQKNGTYLERNKYNKYNKYVFIRYLQSITQALQLLILD
jgi:hypothetical protein